MTISRIIDKDILVLPKKTKIAVGLSGGVDSSVTAYLLKELGMDVTAVFLKCWSRGFGCSSEKDLVDAVKVAEYLDVPLKVYDFQKEYQKQVIDRFFEEYKEGLTPNPDIWCNESIKFGLFLEHALYDLEVDFIATGHYIRKSKIKDQKSKIRGYGLLTAIDTTKDQSYFLYRLNQKQLSRSLFPAGTLTKQLVRETARKIGLFNWRKKDSVGICFIGDVNVVDILKSQIPTKKGQVINSQEQVIGEHDGVWFYTVGQRHGFQIGQYQGNPLYVIRKNVSNNRLVVGRDKESEVREFMVRNLHWIGESQKESEDLKVRIRHLGELMPCVIKKEGLSLIVGLKVATRGVAPGQHAVFYKRPQDRGGRRLGYEVLGGGVIGD